MLKFFIKTYDPKSIMTYADLRFGRGKCYAQVGFSFIGRTVPNYYYFKKNGDELESMMKYQKNKLVSSKNYDPDLTEFDIMSRDGFLRLYDCGNNKYVWNKT